ncbi:hypothetical protein [Nitrosomonas marina]|uniref:Protein TonB, links inner and outer membranes n=1 Tax=Nitrosomonas marina TaxID=917 RepID=A0A1H8FQX4_9PROT|nr:hypothetical protein [Nitrosomonas marina]SEN33498.1 protein TonB, links inner and outer membranes [Nitrosomonas marina]
MTDSRSREIRLWWPLPLSALIWLLLIWTFGFFLSESDDEIEVAITVPDAIEAEFLELPELAQPQESVPPPRKGVETPSETPPQVEPEPAVKTPPPPPVRPQTPPVRSDAVTVPKTQQPEKKTTTEATQSKNAETPADLSEYINQRRPQPQQHAVPERPAGIFDGPEYASNNNTQPQSSAEEIRMAKVRRNLQTPGTSGIFQILELRTTYARFSFRAWTTGISNPRREIVQVETEPGGDIERAVIRRMIQLIRQYHQEDFNWESHRLNRVIVLSARPGDQEGLENFLMREFFGEPLPPYMR